MYFTLDFGIEFSTILLTEKNNLCTLNISAEYEDPASRLFYKMIIGMTTGNYFNKCLVLHRKLKRMCHEMLFFNKDVNEKIH